MSSGMRSPRRLCSCSFLHRGPQRRFPAPESPLMAKSHQNSEAFQFVSSLSFSPFSGVFQARSECSFKWFSNLKAAHPRLSPLAISQFEKFPIHESRQAPNPSHPASKASSLQLLQFEIARLELRIPSQCFHARGLGSRASAGPFARRCRPSGLSNSGRSL